MKFRLYHWTLISLHAVMTAAIIFICIGLYFIGKHVDNTLTATDQDLIGIHASLNIINKPDSGTLAEVDKTLLSSKSILVHTDMILSHEEKQLSTLDSQEQQLFNDIHGLTIKIGGKDGTIDSLNGTLNAVTAVLKTTNDPDTGIGPMLKAGTQTINDADLFINDPHLKKFTANLEPLSNNAVAITGNVSGITNNLNATTADFQTKFHTWLYPVPCKTASCKWGKVFNFALDASKFAEPIDFLTQAYESTKK